MLGKAPAPQDRGTQEQEQECAGKGVSKSEVISFPKTKSETDCDTTSLSQKETRRATYTGTHTLIFKRFGMHDNSGFKQRLGACQGSELLLEKNNIIMR
jgi:hypothetical protein